LKLDVRPVPESSRIPPAIGRVEKTLSIIEEIEARLRSVEEALSFIDADARRLEGLSIRDHFGAVEEIGNAIDAIVVEVDVLETRIATIESLKRHRK
jgi:phosphopantetheine adenylyltransferase